MIIRDKRCHNCQKKDGVSQDKDLTTVIKFDDDGPSECVAGRVAPAGHDVSIGGGALR
jgi:hypothetical protein